MFAKSNIVKIIVLGISLKSFSASIEHNQKIFENCEQDFEWIKQPYIVPDQKFNLLHQACKIHDKDCNYVAKASFDIDSFNNEVYWLERLASTDIIPQIYKSYQCTVKRSNTDPERDLGIIIMERFDGTLDSLLKSLKYNDYTDSFLNNIANYFNILAELKIVHSDIKTDNIFYKIMPDGEVKFVIADWETARTEDDFSLLRNRTIRSTYWLLCSNNVPYFNEEIKNEGQHLYYDRICFERDLLEEFGKLFFMNIPNHIRILFKEQFGYHYPDKIIL